MSVIVGLVGIEKPAAKPIVIVSPTLRAPVALEVKPTVQVERALPVCGEPVKVTAVGAVAAAIVTLRRGAGGGRVGARRDREVGGGDRRRRSGW